MLRQPDHLQFIFAYENLRIFITHNEDDYFLLHSLCRDWSILRDGPGHSGILSLPQIRGILPDLVASYIHRFVETEPALSRQMYKMNRFGGFDLLD